MQVRILHSNYADVPVGTIGELEKPYLSGWAVRVTRHFTVPGACHGGETQTRTLFFEHAELDFGTTNLPEPTKVTVEPDKAKAKPKAKKPRTRTKKTKH